MSHITINTTTLRNSWIKYFFISGVASSPVFLGEHNTNVYEGNPSAHDIDVHINSLVKIIANVLCGM